MPGPTTVTAAQLVRLIGTPECPTLIDVRDDTADARQIPGANRCTAEAPDTWANTLPPRAAIVVCEDGMLSAGVAALVFDFRNLGAAYSKKTRVFIGNRLWPACTA